MKKKQLKITVHPTIHKRLKMLAAKQCKSLNYIMDVAIANFLAKYEHIDYTKIFEKKDE